MTHLPGSLDTCQGRFTAGAGGAVCLTDSIVVISAEFPERRIDPQSRSVHGIHRVQDIRVLANTENSSDRLHSSC